MRASDACLAIIKEAEGFRDKWYLDENDGWTIGYGHLRKPGDNFEEVTELEAEELLKKDVGWAEDCINHYVQVPLSQGQFDALVDFVYNVGPHAFLESTLLRLLNRGAYDAAAKQFGRWIYDDGKVEQGLVKRRTRETALFLQEATV